MQLVATGTDQVAGPAGEAVESLRQGDLDAFWTTLSDLPGWLWIVLLLIVLFLANRRR